MGSPQVERVADATPGLRSGASGCPAVPGPTNAAGVTALTAGSGHHGHAMDGPLRIGISRCLLGDLVRYDGGHKHVPSLVEWLAAHAEVWPICPEV
ncbi:MAG: 2-thiouracil desulfurase family protein, partial [Vicinamibacterales bacterium]